MDSLSKLRWRCRRGMKELDAILNRYLEQVFPQADPQEQALFIELLDEQDPELWNYFLGRTQAPRADLQQLVEKMLAQPIV